MKKPARLFVAVLAVLLTAAPLVAQTPKVLLVGDSWAAQQWSDQAHAAVFLANGAEQYQVLGATTTESGSTAAEWAAADKLLLIEQALAANPGIDTVQLTIGGNDFLNAWSTTMTPKQVHALQEQILLDLGTVTQFVLGQRPDIEVILSLYDYPNFRDTLSSAVGLLFCQPLHNSLGQPTPLQLNLAMMDFEAALAALATHPRVRHVGHAGHMQYTFGLPGDGIAPGQLPPPGDLSLPSPVASMRSHGILGRDCFHLTPSGYDVLVQNLYDNYFEVRFDTLLRSPFE